jgi:hypothetical protein
MAECSYQPDGTSPLGRDMAKAAKHFLENGVTVLVTCHRKKPMLSPFFAKCDGMLILDADARFILFRANTERTSRSACEMVLGSGTKKLVCGFVAPPERELLVAEGIDVRIGSCACPVDLLVQGFEALPFA